MTRFLSAFMSGGAIILSTWTTYVTIFDERYTLTAAVAQVGWSVQTSGYSSSSDGVREVRRAPYVAPTLIASNQGTTSMVFTRISLHRSTNAETCTAPEGDDSLRPLRRENKPEIYAPDMMQTMQLEFALPAIESNQNAPADLEPLSGLWCFSLLVFDNEGRRHEPLMPAFTLSPTLVPSDDPDDDPDLELNLEYPKAAVELVSRGGVSPW